MPNSDEQERFCDEFAAELLLPTAAVRSLRPTPDSIVELHRRFDVSLEVAARSMSSAHPRMACWLLVLREAATPIVQWRSRASYSIEMNIDETAALVRGIIGRRPGDETVAMARGVGMPIRRAWLSRRHQALVVGAPAR